MTSSDKRREGSNFEPPPGWGGFGGFGKEVLQALISAAQDSISLICFSSMGGARASRQRAMAGEDLEAAVEITPEQAFNGTSVKSLFERTGTAA